MDCTLCSLMSFLFSCIYNVITCALEYRLIVFLLSIFITVVMMTNVQTAMLISNRNVHHNCTRHSEPHTWNSSNVNQSPINISTDRVQKLPIRELLSWNHYYDLPTSVCLENNGHTVIVRANYSGNIPSLSGADLLYNYTFVELRFRWSQINSEGSEHMLDYKKFPMEMQAMHRTGPVRGSSYDLLQVAYFYDILTHNPYLDPIVVNLQRIRKPNTRVEIPPFPLAYLCNQFRTDFYSYGGSLTEPPCQQGVEWFVASEALTISELQLNEFRQLLSSDGCTRILRNARPVQNVDSTRLVILNQYQPLCTWNNSSMESTECNEQLECEEQMNMTQESC